MASIFYVYTIKVQTAKKFQDSLFVFSNVTFDVDVVVIGVDCNLDYI